MQPVLMYIETAIPKNPAALCQQTQFLLIPVFTAFLLL